MSKYFKSEYGSYRYFNSSSVSNKITGLENSLRRQGVNPPPVAPRSTLDRIFDALSVGQYAIMGGLRSMTDRDMNTTIGKGFVEGLKAGNPFGNGYEKGEASFSDVLGNMGVNPKTGGGKFFKGVASFAGDVLLDPTTYLTLGAKPLLQGSIKAVGKETLENSLKEIAEKQAPEILTKLGLDSSDDTIQGLVNKVKRTSKYFPTETKGMNFAGKTLVADDVLRKIGDNTIAPTYNKIADRFKNSDFSKKMSEIFVSENSRNLVKTARDNPLDAFKRFALEQAQNTAWGRVSKLQRQLADNVEEMFSGMDDEKKSFLTDLMENPTAWKNIEVEIGQGNKLKKTAEAEEFYNALKSVRDDLQTKVDKYNQAGIAKERVDKLMSISDSLDEILDGQIDTSDIFGSMLNKGSEALEGLRSLPKQKVYEILNDMRNDEVGTIIKKLTDMGYDNAEEMAYQIRQALDKAIGETVEPASRKYFAGFEDVTKMDETDKAYQHLFSEADDAGILNSLTLRALSDAKYDDEQILKSLIKRTGNEDKAKKILSDSKQIHEKNLVEAEQMKTKTERYNRVMKELVEMSQIRSGYIKTLSDKLPDIKNKQQIIKDMLDGKVKQNKLVFELFKLKTPEYKVQQIVGEIEKLKKTKKYASNDVLHKMLRDNGFAQDEAFNMIKIADELANRDGSKDVILDKFARQDEARKAKYFKDNEIPTSEFDEMDVKRLKFSDEIEYENRVKPHEKGYAGSFDDVEDPTHLRDLVFKALDNQYNSVKIKKAMKQYLSEDKIDDTFKKYLNEYMDKLEIKQKPYIEKGYFNAKNVVEPKEGTHAVYNINGTKVMDSIDNPSNVKPSMIKKGLEYISSKNQKLGTLLHDLNITLNDVDTNAEGIYQSIAKQVGDKKEYTNRVIMPKNKIAKNPEQLTTRVVEKIMAHEFGHSIQNRLDLKNGFWKELIQLDKKQIAVRGGASEDFAESVSMYLKNPAQLRASYPKRFEAIDEAIRNFKPTKESWQRIESETLEEAGVQIPKTARNVLDKEMDKANKSYDEILTEAVNNGDEKLLRDNLVKMNKKLEEDNWQKAFKDSFGHDKTHEMVMETITKTMRIFDGTGIDDKDIRVINHIKDHFKDMAHTEGIEHVIEDYVTHMFSEDMKNLIGNKGAGVAQNNWNPYNIQRQYDETIKKFNARVKKKYGIDNAFETDLSKIYLARALKHNQLVFKKQTYDRLIETFGHIVENGEQIVGDKKLYASIEDVQNILRKIMPDNMGDIVREVNLPKEVTDKVMSKISSGNYDSILADLIDSKDITPEQLSELNSQIQTAISNKHIEFLKNIGLPTEIIGSERAVVQINADVFHRFKNINAKFSGFHMPDTAIDMVNKMGLAQMKEDKHFLLDIYDKALNLWKVNNTAVNPGFHFRNAFSNMFQEYLAVGKSALDIDTQSKAFMLANKVYSNDDLFAEIADARRAYMTMKDDMSEVDFKQVIDDLISDEENIKVGNYDDLKMLNSDLVEKAKKFETTKIRTANGKEYSMTQIKDLAQQLGIIDTGFFKGDGLGEIKNPIKEAYSEFADKGAKAKDKLQYINPLNEKKNALYRAGREAGSFVENQAKIANFIANLKIGKDPYEAAERVTKFMFDYTDLSDIEKNFMKRAVPFYTWMRKNIPLQLEQLMEQPNTYRGAAKAMNAIRNMTPEDERVKKEDMNSFAREWLQLPIKTKNNQGKEEPVFLNPNMPFGDLNKLSLNPIDNIQTGMGSLSPFIKLPIELGMNKNIYFNSPISRGIGDTDDAPGYLQALLRQMDDPKTKSANEALQMSPELRYILRNIGSLENVSKAIEKSGDKAEGQILSDKTLALLNALGGVKLYSYDVDKYKEWSEKDRLKQLQDLQRSVIKKRAAKRQ